MPGGPSGSTVTRLGSPSSEACGGSHSLPVSPVPKGLRVALLWKLQPFSALLPERSFQNHTATFRMESFLPPPAPLHSSGGCLLCSPPHLSGLLTFLGTKIADCPFCLIQGGFHAPQPHHQKGNSPKRMAKTWRGKEPPPSSRKF